MSIDPKTDETNEIEDTKAEDVPDEALDIVTGGRRINSLNPQPLPP